MKTHRKRPSGPASALGGLLHLPQRTPTFLGCSHCLIHLCFLGRKSPGFTHSVLALGQQQLTNQDRSQEPSSQLGHVKACSTPPLFPVSFTVFSFYLLVKQTAKPKYFRPSNLGLEGKHAIINYNSKSKRSSWDKMLMCFCSELIWP